MLGPFTRSPTTAQMDSVSMGDFEPRNQVKLWLLYQSGTSWNVKSVANVATCSGQAVAVVPNGSNRKETCMSPPTRMEGVAWTIEPPWTVPNSVWKTHPAGGSR